LPEGSSYIKKTYNLTIEPGADKKLVKRPKAPHDRKRDAESWLPELAPSSADNDNGSQSPLPLHAMKKQQDYFQKSSFRQHRIPAFSKSKHFPALVNHRLVPEWSDTEHFTEDHSGTIRDIDGRLLKPKERIQKRLIAPTLAGAMRMQPKKPPLEGGISWQPHGDCDETRKQYCRLPVLHQEPRCQGDRRSVEEEEAKKRWVGESTFSCDVPGAKIALMRSNAGPDRVEVEKEIHEVRERGAQNKVKLQDRYDKRLDAFKTRQSKGGHLSSFAKRELRLEVLKKEVKPPEEKQEVVENVGFSILNFSRYRNDNKPAIEN
jgi:hypothetical protein